METLAPVGFYLRFPPDLIEQVRNAAGTEDVSVAHWIRTACRHRLEPGVKADRSFLDEIPTRLEVNRMTEVTTSSTCEPHRPPPPDVAICEHPRKALVTLTGGLARCGACGINRRADGSWPE